jgi:hypothetical protein
LGNNVVDSSAGMSVTMLSRTLNRKISPLIVHVDSRPHATLAVNEKIVILSREGGHVIFARLSDWERAGRDEFILETKAFDKATEQGTA